MSTNQTNNTPPPVPVQPNSSNDSRPNQGAPLAPTPPTYSAGNAQASIEGVLSNFLNKLEQGQESSAIETLIKDAKTLPEPERTRVLGAIFTRQLQGYSKELKGANQVREDIIEMLKTLKREEEVTRARINLEKSASAISPPPQAPGISQTLANKQTPAPPDVSPDLPHPAEQTAPTSPTAPAIPPTPAPAPTPTPIPATEAPAQTSPDAPAQSEQSYPSNQTNLPEPTQSAGLVSPAREAPPVPPVDTVSPPTSPASQQQGGAFGLSDRPSVSDSPPTPPPPSADKTSFVDSANQANLASADTPPSAPPVAPVNPQASPEQTTKEPLPASQNPSESKTGGLPADADFLGKEPDKLANGGQAQNSAPAEKSPEDPPVSDVPPPIPDQ